MYSLYFSEILYENVNIMQTMENVKLYDSFIDKTNESVKSQSEKLPPNLSAKAMEFIPKPLMFM